MAKLFAFYLPQFHRIPENDEWWGEGFTEWVNVKKAKPLFKNHNQPLIPLNQNYYCLLDKKTVEWQTALMKNYGIDGFIYYHYYFTGKKLLEKPAENLLKWKDINQPFFFCWANHSWNRSWEGMRTVLLEQKYGTVAEWEEHFRYLLPFFKDPRYEKKDNKPLFMIYQPGFAEKKDMIEYFNQRCIESGFDGIAIIETLNDINALNNNTCPMKSIEYYFCREPSISKKIYETEKRFYIQRGINKLLRIIDKSIFHKPAIIKYKGDILYKCSLKRIDYSDKALIPGMFFSWDNTPRHGYRGYIITPPSHDTFVKYMNHIKNSDYIFINAWNEWAEGMILEPTEGNGFKYLEWIKEWRQRNEK